MRLNEGGARSWPSVVSLGMLGALVIPAGQCGAQAFSPYSEFQAMSVQDMDSLRVKVTYGGPQDALIATLAFARPATTVQMGAFTPYRRAGFEYSNDDGPVATVRMTREELRALIDSVGTNPDVTDGDVDSGGYVSFSLLSTLGDTTRVFEAVVNQSSGRNLFRGLMAGAKGNTLGVEVLRRMACDVGLLPPELPTNAQGSAVVTFGGLRPDRGKKGVFVGKVRAMNSSGATLAAPLSLVVIRVGGNARLIEAQGTTCALSPRGAYFIDLPVGAGLASGKAVEKVLHFSNPSLVKFDLQFRVFWGYGSR